MAPSGKRAGVLLNILQRTGQPPQQWSGPRCQPCQDTVAGRPAKTKRQSKVSIVYPLSYRAYCVFTGHAFPLSATRWPLAPRINENSTRVDHFLETRSLRYLLVDCQDEKETVRKVDLPLTKY